MRKVQNLQVTIEWTNRFIMGIPGGKQRQGQKAYLKENDQKIHK